MCEKKVKNKIFIGIGANLVPRGYSSVQDGLNAAMNMLSGYGIELIQCSSWYETSPVPKSNQPLFRNAVFSASCDLNPLELLYCLNDLEAKIGRIRTSRNSARVLDLDILDFNAQSVDLERLTIPHPRMHLRAFVLIPLQEIRADYIHPVTKKTIISLINDLPDEQEISRLPD